VTGSVIFAGDYSTAAGALCILAFPGKFVDVFQGGAPSIGPELFITFPQVLAYYDDENLLAPIYSIEPMITVGSSEENSIITTGCAVLGSTVYASCAAAEAAIPEPASLALFGTALAGLVAVRRRRSRRQR
jgi:hypothetical protein